MTRAIACGIVACLLSGCSSMGNMVQPLAPFAQGLPSGAVPGLEPEPASVNRTGEAKASKEASEITSGDVRLI